MTESYSFKNNLMAMANSFCREIGRSELNDVEDAVVLVLSHIITSIQIRNDHIPLEGCLKETDALSDSTFLCFVACQLVLYIEQEEETDAELSINDIIADAGLSVFQFLDNNTAFNIICKGMEIYKKITEANSQENTIHNYTNTLSTHVYEYVMHRNEQSINELSKQYAVLHSMVENHR